MNQFKLEVKFERSDTIWIHTRFPIPPSLLGKIGNIKGVQFAASSGVKAYVNKGELFAVDEIMSEITQVLRNYCIANKIKEEEHSVLELKRLLKEAVDDENYELAAHLNTKIKNFKNK